VTVSFWGSTGRILRVDLNNGKMTVEMLDEGTVRKYMGGTCLGMKYLLEEVAPEGQWSAPENRIFVGSGPLGGTGVPGSGSISFVAKGAMTNGSVSTQANGFFGAFLRRAGYDGIMIQGAGDHWQYLCIDGEGKAYLRDASHLIGQDTWDTEEMIKKELGYGEHEMSVFSIGPAGEHLVRFACVVGDKGHVAAHNGIGAVMGSKKLKALAVARGKGEIPIKDKDGVIAVAKKIVESARETENYKWGTSRTISRGEAAGWLPVRNYTTSVFPEHTLFNGERIRKLYEIKRAACWACPSNHCHLMKVTEGPYTGYSGEEPEYEQWAAWGPQIFNKEPGSAAMLANEVDRLGMDCNEAGWVVGWVMECYEKGVLTRDDLDGLELTWGNVEAALELLKNIAYRRGYGDVLAEGVKRAAEKLDGEAINWAIFTGKGNTPRGHDHRGRWVELFDTCVSNTGTVETNPGLIPDLTVYGLPKTYDIFSPIEVSTVAAKTKGSYQILDSLVLCAFAVNLDIPLVAEALKAATGWNIDAEEALKLGRRAVNMMRVFNVRAGLTPDLEYPSPRYGSVAVDGAAKGRAIMPHWEEMLDNYYCLMGWDRKTGLPLPETLRELGLEHLLN